MKNWLKYLLIFLCIFAFAFIASKKFITDDLWCYVIGAVTGLAISYAGRRYITGKAFSYLFFTCMFLLIIFIPFAGPKESVSLEKRKLAAFPEFKVSNVWKFFKQYNDYFSDRFAFRNEGLILIARIKMTVFGISSVPDKVAIGDDDWLFSSGFYFLQITCDPFTQDELKLMNTNLEIITRWLDQHGIKYYFTCVPVKGRIYPEKLPGDLKWLMANSRLKQLYDHIKDNTKINVVDVRDELIEGKKIRETYLKTDTHWNQFGAFLGYTKIMQAMKRDFPDLYIYQMSDFNLVPEMTDGGDLMQCLGLETGIPYEQYIMNLKSGKTPEVIDSSYTGDLKKIIFIRQMKESKNKQKIFVVHDSMTMFLKLFISPSFQRSFYYWKPMLNIPLIMNEKPDIVLHEMSEVFIADLIRIPLEIEADSAFMKTYYPDYLQLKNKIDKNHIIYFD